MKCLVSYKHRMVCLCHCIPLSESSLLSHMSQSTWYPSENERKFVNIQPHTEVKFAQKTIVKGLLTRPHSPVIHVGHGLMLHASLAEGWFSVSHPGLKRPFGNLQSTVLSLEPFPQETEHYKKERESAPLSLEFHLMQCIIVLLYVVCSFYFSSHIFCVSGFSQSTVAGNWRTAGRIDPLAFNCCVT